MTQPVHPRDTIEGILSAIVPTVVVAISVTMQPGLVQGMVDFVGVDEVKAGYIASAEVLGLMAGTVAFPFIATRIDWRLVMGGALLLLILANLATITIGGAGSLTAFRALAGLGAGLVTAVGFASLANTKHAGRNYGWLVAWVIGFSAVGFALLPAIFKIGGYHALIGIYTLLVAGCLVATKFVNSDHSSHPSSDASHGDRVLSVPGFLILASVLLFFIGYTGAWTYMSLIGRDSGLKDGQIAGVLSQTQFFGVAGALSISVLSERVGNRLLALAVYGVGALGLFALNAHLNNTVYFVLNAIFQYCWSGGQSLLLAIIAARRSSGNLLRIAIPIQFIGMGVAPGIAATVLSMSGGYNMVILISGMAAAASAFAIAPFVSGLQHKQIVETHVR